jgi:hypothetical protein
MDRVHREVENIRASTHLSSDSDGYDVAYDDDGSWASYQTQRDHLPRGTYGGTAGTDGGDIFNRLVDSRLFTGTHKHRFDEYGRGRGLAGRESVAKGTGCSPVAVYSGGGVADISQIMRNRGLKSPGSPERSFRSPASFYSTPPSSGTARSPRAQSDIFDRLANPAGFTGVHRHRFDARGNGRGLAGRDFVSKGSGTVVGRANAGEIQDISQITRGPMPPKQRTGDITSARRRKKQGTKSTDIFNKLTDPSMYTGHHRQRFDEEGRGLGLAGRESVTKGQGAWADRRPHGEYTDGGPVPCISQIVRSEFDRHSPRAYATSGGSPSYPSTFSRPRSDRDHQSSDGALEVEDLQAVDPHAEPPPHVFSKLTNPALFTGHHRNRFDDSGRGRGMQGRDEPRRGAAAGQIIRDQDDENDDR